MLFLTIKQCLHEDMDDSLMEKNMLQDLVTHVANETGMTRLMARNALGILFNASDRQGSEFTAQVFEKMPGARKLAAKAGEELGAAQGVIAKLIEQTPGGRMAVATGMIRDLQKLGLGHEQIAKLLPSVGGYCEAEYGLKGFGHLGDFLGPQKEKGKQAAAFA